MTKNKEYHFPLVEEFEDKYLNKIVFRNDRSKPNILSRLNSIFISGYKPRGSSQRIFFNQGLEECIKSIPSIVESKKAYHGIALQTLAAIFIKIRQEIDKKGRKSALNDLQSALIHYYIFIEKKLNKAKCNKSKLTEVNAKSLQDNLNYFWGQSTNVACFTQKEVRDNFRLRLHSQNRLYNPMLLFPITLIEKLLSSSYLAEKWTYNVIDNIKILINEKEGTIEFKEISFFLFSDKIYVFDRKGKKYIMYTRTYNVTPGELREMHVRSFEQPLKTFAIDHSKPMMSLIQEQVDKFEKDKKNVPQLKLLSDDFIRFIKEYGNRCLKESDDDTRQRNNSLDILNSKTINALANGYIKFLKDNQISMSDDQKKGIIDDLKTLHGDGGLELMDLLENGKKGADV